MKRDFKLAFVSSDTLNMHFEYLNDLKLKYSVLIKSYPMLAGADIKDIKRMRLEEAVKKKTVDLITEINSHECYFNSFCTDPQPYKPIKKYFSSEDAFAYEVFIASKESKKPFVYVYKDKSGVPFITEDYMGEAVFAIDLSEHSYFLDYGFAREEYIKRALGYLDLEKLSIVPLDKTAEK